MKNKLLLWDIDGTLMTCYGDGTKALNETFRRRTGCENACGSVIAGTLMDSQFADRIMERLNIPSEKKSEIVKEFGVILKDIVESNPEKKILPGIVEILDILKQEESVYMGLLTSNFKLGAQIKLSSVGLWDYFKADKFGGFGDYPGEKWDAAEKAILKAQEISGLKFDKDSIYIIGDTAYDVECARKNGIKSIAVATGWMSYEKLKAANPDYLFESLENIHDFLTIIMK